MKFPKQLIGLVGWLVLCGAQTGCKDGEDPPKGATGGSGNGAGMSGEGASEAGTTSWDGRGGTQSDAHVGGGGTPDSLSAGGQHDGSQSGGGASAKQFGQALLVSIRSNGAPTRVMIANFFSRSGSDCASVQYGSCTLTPPCAETYTPIYASAGTLAISSTNSAINVSMTPSADKTYVSVSASTGLSGGEALHFTASGGDVPAFSSDVTASLVLLIDSPVPDGNGEISASPTQDLVIRFSRGGPGVQLYGQSTTSSGTLVCTSDSAASALTIPAAALTALGAGATLPLWTFTRTVVTAGSFEITTGTLMDAYTPDKSHPVTVKVQ